MIRWFGILALSVLAMACWKTAPVSIPQAPPRLVSCTARVMVTVVGTDNRLHTTDALSPALCVCDDNLIRVCGSTQ